MTITTLTRRAAPRLAPPGPAMRGEAGAILRLAGPISLVMLINMAMSITDTLMSARFGARGLAAVAVGSDYYTILLCFAGGAIAGIAPLYAGAAAVMDTARLARLRAAGWVLVGLAGAVALPVVWLAPSYLGRLGIPQDLLEDGAGYTRAMALTLLPMFVVTLLRQQLTARQNPGLLVKVTLCAVPLNAALNAVLMFGIGGWPGLGITGAGVSSCVVACFTALVLVGICRKQGDFHIDWRGGMAEIASVLRLGLPIGLATLAELGVFLGATLYAARFGAEQAAAHALALRLAGVAYAVSAGLLQAGMVRAARNEELHGRAGRRDVLAAGLGLGLVAGAAQFAVISAVASPLAGMVFGAAATAPLAAGLIGLLALSEAAAPVGSAAAGLMRGLKDTRMPMIFSLIGNWGVCVPLAGLLASGAQMGVTGIWIALVAGTAVTALLTALGLRRHWPAAAGTAEPPAIGFAREKELAA